jgi:uncharacterized membrane protein
MKREAALFTIALALGTTMLVPRTDAQAPATNAAGLSFTTIDVPFSGVSETQAIGINNRGQIVGFYNDSTGMHGFVDDNGRFDAINVPIPGAIGTELDGVNDRGQIVGAYVDAGGIHGFLAGPCFAQGMPVLRLDDDGNPVFLRVRCKDDDPDQEHGEFSER